MVLHCYVCPLLEVEARKEECYKAMITYKEMY